MDILNSKIKRYRVTGRWVNIHTGAIVALPPELAEQFEGKIKDAAYGRYEVVKPIQIPHDVIFGYEGELSPLNAVRC